MQSNFESLLNEMQRDLSLLEKFDLPRADRMIDAPRKQWRAKAKRRGSEYQQRKLTRLAMRRFRVSSKIKDLKKGIQTVQEMKAREEAECKFCVIDVNTGEAIASVGDEQ